MGSAGSPGLPSLAQQTLLAGPVQGWGHGVCVIPELVRKPGLAWLILSPAVGSQARDSPSSHCPLENWESLPLWMETDVESHRAARRTAFANTGGQP